jgi:hypothetical protein
LLAFERATTVFSTGSAPSPQDCERFTSSVLPKIVRDSNSLDPLTRRIPDPVLASAFSQDVRIKLIVGLGCSELATQHRPQITGATAEQGYATVRTFTERVKRLLAQYGIAV